MGENIPPATAAMAATGDAGAAVAPISNGADQQPAQTRGIPYYEKLRRELRDTLQKKRLMDKNMATLEESIYRFEHSYLEETGAGNIIKGFDNYIKGASSSSNLGGGGGLGSSFAGIGSTGGGPSTRRKCQVSEMDRVFSRSSASFMRDSPAPSSAHTTPSHAPTPASAGPGNKTGDNKENIFGAASIKIGANKKSRKSIAEGPTAARRDRELDDGDNKQPLKRLKITYARGE
ncbi:hypothetical protein FQN57_001004 [Myotisia sp. PD_48]|nr:hypothetical protein FQN57_001004 [Myotisia sp. PD_48]